MSKKHFELITATNRAEFAEKVNKRLQEGWELLGNAGIASEPGVPGISCRLWFQAVMTREAPLSPRHPTANRSGITLW